MPSRVHEVHCHPRQCLPEPVDRQLVAPDVPQPPDADYWQWQPCSWRKTRIKRHIRQYISCKRFQNTPKHTKCSQRRAKNVSRITSIGRNLRLWKSLRARLKRPFPPCAGTSRLWNRQAGCAGIHGGARLVTPHSDEFAFSARDTRQLAEKEAIGRACAELIQPGQSVIIDAGTTAYHAARYLESKAPQIITNSLPVANLFAAGHRLELIVPAASFTRGSVCWSGRWPSRHSRRCTPTWRL